MDTTHIIYDFCSFILRYKSDFTKFTSYTLGSLKGRHGDLYKKIKNIISMPDDEEIMIDSLIQSLLRLFQIFVNSLVGVNYKITFMDHAIYELIKLMSSDNFKITNENLQIVNDDFEDINHIELTVRNVLDEQNTPPNRTIVTATTNTY